MSPLMASPLITHIILTVGLYSVISVSSELTSDSKSYTETELDSELLCKGEWKFPNKCNTYNCDYKASWEYIDDNDEIMFTISTKNRNKWTGIGFSENQAMPETDAILGLVEERFET
ncbi:unnamed protein product [Medioppia subpectinata]|uniref:DOMON domain-containing protein n=1 Tax=Medioppia subpectinata TaxID=1979941 RepID=A0A7R9LGD2_9ACAR|nr:unnamed protein product [Medioppia subpectinata]CAG2118561.1 unnamed protein product [Medioppia subpectinata]